MLPKSLIVIFLISIATATFAQRIQISGYITDQSSGEGLIGANIQVPDTQTGTISNEYGYFSLVVDAEESRQLVISYVGYTADTLNIPTDKASVSLQVKLKPVTLETIEITATQLSSEVGQVAVSVERLKLIPVLLGEPDLFKALSLLPGISTGVEGTSGLFIRGGSPDQNLVLLDGGNVYNTGHLFGFISVFNPATVQSVEVIKGGIPARYGGRLGAVVDVHLKEGNNQTKQVEKSFGLINSSYTIQGPIQEGRSSYLLAGRLAYTGLLSGISWLGYQNGSAPFTFGGLYDLTAKANFTLRQNDKLFVSWYSGDHFLWIKRKDGERRENNFLGWGNQTAAIRYNRILGQQVFSHTLFNFNRFRYNIRASVAEEAQNNLIEVDNRSTVREFTLKQHFSASFGKHDLYAGIDASNALFRPNYATSTTDFNSLDSLLETTQVDYLTYQLAAFLEDEWQVSKTVRIGLGLRWQLYRTEEQSYQFWEPRLKLLWDADPQLSFQLAYDKTSQNLHLLSTSGGGLPNDIWVPFTEKVPPQQANQFSAGMRYQFPERPLQLSVEGYYRSLANLIDFRSGETLFTNENLNWQDVIEKNGRGETYGIEFLLEAQLSSTSWWLAYTLSKSTRTFETINRGRTYPFHYDRRHDVSLTIAHQLNEKWSLSSNFIFQTGHAITLPNVLLEDFAGRLKLVYTERNNARMPAYHRLDISLNKDFITKKNRAARWSFGLYNIYNRRNAVSIDYGFTSEGRLEGGLWSNLTPQLKSQALFGIVPAVSYSVKY